MSLKKTKWEAESEARMVSLHPHAEFDVSKSGIIHSETCGTDACSSPDDSIYYSDRTVLRYIAAEQIDEESEDAGPPLRGGAAGDIINRIRSECRKFHTSPKLNDELATHTQADGCQVKLAMDVKTRWNSTFRMLKNFLKVTPSLQRFYGECFPFSEDEMSVARDIATALSHVDLCSSRLSLADITLRNADLALQVG